MKKMKCREELLPIIKIRRLLHRLDPHHPKYATIKNTLVTLEVGQYGESLVDYPLSHINQPNLFLFESLRLPITNTEFFQMDFLLITPQVIIIIESKYIKGDIWLDPHQMVRTIDGHTEVFPSPIQQVNNQSYHLISLLRKHSFPILPNRNLVVFSNSQAKLNIDREYQVARKFVYRTDSIREQIEKTLLQTKPEILSEEDMYKIAKLLNKLHTPDNRCVLERFAIDFSELKKGVYCSYCRDFTMVKKGSWKCLICQKADDQSYIDALLDYYYLGGEKITSKKCMEFLNLNSLSVAIKKLKKLKCKFKVTGRNYTFHLNKNKLIRMKKN